MATSGVMADFARMSTGKKVAVFVAIGAVLGLLYFRFVFSSLEEKVELVEADHEQAVARNNQLEADIPRYAALRETFSQLQAKIAENQKALPTGAELPAFFEMLERKVRESGVEIVKWTKKNEEPIESFVKVPVDIELTGTFMQLKRFFASLVQKSVAPISPTGELVEERERIVSIEGLSLTTPTIRNREIVLTAKFTAVTFRQEDKAAEAAPAPGQAATAPGGAAAPPLPSAGTPAGAKARTEDALQKSEDRLKGGM
jgi:type IV pilus assembly protein PilO